MSPQEEYKYTKLGLIVAAVLVLVLSGVFAAVNANVSHPFAEGDLCSQIQTAGNCEEFE